MAANSALPSPKQRAFAAYYASGLDATTAARRAGYSPKSAQSMGSQLVHNPDVRQVIDDLLYQATVRQGITPDRIIGELASIAFYRGSEPGQGPEYKDRLSALDKLARMHGLYDDSITLRIDREALEKTAREAGVDVEVLEAEYRLLTEGPSR